MNLIEKWIAAFIERSCKNYITTIIGVIGVILYAANTFLSVIPAQYHDWVTMGASVLTGVALILAKDSDTPPPTLPVVSKVGLFLLAALLLPGVVHGQTAPATSNGFVADSSAVALHYNGTWSAGSHITEAYDFYDFGKSKANRLYLAGHELMAPTPGFNVYAGGVMLEPNLAALGNKFNVPAGTFSAQFDAALGNGVPSTGGSHISAIVGGRIKYRATSQLSWNALEVQWVRYGKENAAAISTGLSFIFGGGK